MRIVLQRVKKAFIVFQEQVVAEIHKGVCLLVGIEKGDCEESADYLAKKIVELRIFPDKNGKMNMSLLDTKGEILAVSQFTLAGSVKKGRRPSFDKAESPGLAEPLFNYFVERLRERGIKVETGVFGAMMDVHLVNDGPVTFIIERKNSDTRNI